MSQEHTHIDATITDLEAWLERIQVALQTLKALRSGGGMLPSVPPPGNTGRANETEIRHDTFFQMTIPDAVEKYLNIVKITKPTPELADALLKGGLKSTAKNFSETVRAIISRDERFVRVNSEWGLATWYPAMRKERKGKGQEPTASETEKPMKGPAKGSSSARAGVFPSDSAKSRIIRTLDEHPQRIYSLAELGQVLGDIKPGTLKAALVELYKRGFIARPQEGRYQSIKAKSIAA